MLFPRLGELLFPARQRGGGRAGEGGSRAREGGGCAGKGAAARGKGAPARGKDAAAQGEEERGKYLCPCAPKHVSACFFKMVFADAMLTSQEIRSTPLR